MSVYDFTAAANAVTPITAAPSWNPNPPAVEAHVKVPTTAAQMIATLLDQAQTRTLHREEVRRANAFLLGSRARHPSNHRGPVA